MRALLLVALLWSALAPALAGAPERRYALVIGNSRYETLGVLANPANDATAIADALGRLGFDVDLQTDLTRDGLEQLVPHVVERAGAADLVMLFYAGHGLAISSRNYIVPVDARLTSDAAVLVEQLVPLSRVMEALDGAAKATLIFLDSCRNNPYNDDASDGVRTARLGITRGLAELSVAAPRKAAPKAAAGLARMDTGGEGLFVAFATRPGEIALDGHGSGARHSPFTAALLDHLATPGLALEGMMSRVRKQVLLATDRRQLPWTQSSLIGDEVYLGGQTAADAAALARPGVPAPVAAPVVPTPPPAPMAPLQQALAVPIPPVTKPEAHEVATPARPQLGPVAGTWHGGAESGWIIEATLDGRRLSGVATCARGALSYRLDAELDGSGAFATWGDRMAPAVIGGEPTLKVDGVFPRARVWGTIGRANPCGGGDVVLARVDRAEKPQQAAALSAVSFDGRWSGAGDTYRVAIDVKGQQFAGTIRCADRDFPVKGRIDADIRIDGAMTLDTVQKPVSGEFPSLFIWSGGPFSPLAYSCGTGETVSLSRAD